MRVDMSRKKASRNAPCPCGSGKKYKNCCYRKNFDWETDDDRGPDESLPFSDDLPEIVERRRKEFVAKHGREPEPDDPVFFDSLPLEQMGDHLVEAMRQAGVDPAFIYAFEETGLLVSDENRHLLSSEDVARWNAAIAEYRARHGQRDAPEFPIGTVALYGPDDKTTTKIAAGVIMEEGAEAIIERWVGTGVKDDAKVQDEIGEFFKKHGVKSVVASERNMGCPHEEGEDFPRGEDCPFCPFWKGKQGSARTE
jgi:hypothetical protein